MCKANGGAILFVSFYGFVFLLLFVGQMIDNCLKKFSFVFFVCSVSMEKVTLCECMDECACK